MWKLALLAGVATAAVFGSTEALATIADAIKVDEHAMEAGSVISGPVLKGVGIVTIAATAIGTAVTDHRGFLGTGMAKLAVLSGGGAAAGLVAVL